MSRASVPIGTTPSGSFDPINAPMGTLWGHEVPTQFTPRKGEPRTHEQWKDGGGPCHSGFGANDTAASPPLEIRQTALGVGLDTFAEILGAAQPVLLDELAFGGGVDRVGEAATHRLARRDHGER